MEFVDYKCLESLLIEGEEIAVTEGLTDKIKSAASFIGRGLMEILRAIRRVLGIIINKVRALLSKKGSKESPKDMVARLTKENEELKAKLSNLESDFKSEKSQNEYLKEDMKRDQDFYDESKKSMQKDFDNMYHLAKDYQSKSKDLEKKNEKLESKKDRATKMIASLKKQIADNEAKMEDAKNIEKKKSYYDKFQNTCMTFIALVSQQSNKAYTALPKLVAEAKKYDNKSRKDLDDRDDEFPGGYDFYSKLQSSLPTMGSGQWSYLYKSLRYSYLDSLKQDAGYLEFSSGIGRGFENLVKESNKTIEYLENMVKDMNNSGAENNPAYKIIIREITMKEGFIPMLQSSVNLANEILNCYTSHNVHIVHTVHDSI